MAAAVAVLCVVASCDDVADDPSTTPAGTSVPSTSTTERETPSTGPASALPQGFDLDGIVTSAVGDSAGGMTALAVRDGEVSTAVAGVKDAAGHPMTAATPSRVGSISKPFIATMVLQLVEEGRVHLDERLGTYLPETPTGADVTIRDLLRHYSGLPNYTDTSSFFPDALAERSRRFEPGDVLAYIAAVRPAPPGERFAYSNTNYILLGQLVEHVDGVDLNTALRARITGPLGLAVTTFAIAGEPSVSGLAGGWSPGVVDGDPEAPYDSIESGAWAAGALVSTTAELAAFLTALFAGDLLTDASLAAMTDTGSAGYGLGLGLDTGLFASDRRGYGHGGGIPGYLSYMAIEPTSGDTVVVLTNNDRIDLEAVLGPMRDDW